MKMSLVSKTNYSDLKLIAGNIAKLNDEGISFTNILELLEELPLRTQYLNAIRRINVCLKNGMSLEDSLIRENDIFPDFFISMVGVGEKTGKLSYVLKGVGIYYGKIDLVKKTFLKALAYPTVLLVALVVLFIFLAVVAVPSLADIYISMNKNLPPICNAMIKFNLFIREKPLVLFMMIVCWGGIVPYVLLSKLKIRSNIIRLDKIPIVKLFNEYVIIVLLSVVVNSGINISKGFNYCCKIKLVGNLEKKIIKINDDLLRGKSLAEAMKESNIFTKYTIAHIELGEEAGGLDERLIVLESELFQNMIFKLNRDMELFQPVLIVFMAMIVMSFIMIFILPLLDGIVVGRA